MHITKISANTWTMEYRLNNQNRQEYGSRNPSLNLVINAGIARRLPPTRTSHFCMLYSWTPVRMANQTVHIPPSTPTHLLPGAQWSVRGSGSHYAHLRTAGSASGGSEMANTLRLISMCGVFSRPLLFLLVLVRCLSQSPAPVVAAVNRSSLCLSQNGE